ncbi:MAG: phosphoribosylanthranilate isomerase [Gemmatimonadota bacterium]|nr:phosphoribosylanthranilate isomerase [Gemmatimonadota bacterium]
MKVCGISDPASARAAVEAGADYLGLVFAPSVRRVTPGQAARLVGDVEASWVGVFVDPRIAELERLAADLDLAALQLHGAESPELCREARRATGRPVWKAVPWSGGSARLEPWESAADAVLLDAGEAGRGGTGDTLPWERLATRWPPARRTVPLVLAGGLGPGNVRRAIEVVAPDGVDASSRLEDAPGRKDPAKIRAFVRAAREVARKPGPSR